jgi:hypothetical protein
VVTTALVLGDHTPYPLYMAAMAVTGIGVGCTIMPTMTAASRPLSGGDLASGTALLVIISQVAVATGTALVAATLSWLSGPQFTSHAAKLTLVVPAVLMAMAWFAAVIPRISEGWPNGSSSSPTSGTPPADAVTATRTGISGRA